MLLSIGQDVAGCHLFLGHHGHDALTDYPWSNAPFDCVVLLCHNRLTHSEIEKLAFALATAATNWIQIAGPRSEYLHDRVDQASVSIGRQSQVGEGSPMTSWHEDAQSLEALAGIALNGFGSEDHLLILVVGNDQEYAHLTSLLQAGLTQTKA